MKTIYLCVLLLFFSLLVSAQKTVSEKKLSKAIAESPQLYQLEDNNYIILVKDDDLKKASLDSLIQFIKNNVTSETVTAPEFLNGFAAWSYPSYITLNFSENIKAVDPDQLAECFTITYNETEIEIDTLIFGSVYQQQIYLQMADPAHIGDEIIANYTKPTSGGLQDNDQNMTSSFVRTITNNSSLEYVSLQIESAVVLDESPNRIDVAFSDQIFLSNMDSAINNLICSVENIEQTIDSLVARNDTLFLYIADSLTYNQSGYVANTATYSDALLDKYSNPLGNVNKTITNNVKLKIVNDTTLIHRWQFENNYTDSEGDADGTPNNQSLSTSFWKQGSYSLSSNYTPGGGNQGFNVGSIDLSDSAFTIVGWNYSTSNQYGIMFATNSNNESAGFQLEYNQWGKNDGELTFHTSNGTGKASATTADGAMTGGKWNHVAVVVNRTGGEAKIYVNSVNKTTNDAAETDFPVTNQTFVLGNRVDYGYSSWGYYDDWRIYNKQLSQEEITYLYNHPNDTTGGGGGGGGWTIDSLDATVYWGQNWDGFSITDTGLMSWNDLRLDTVFPAPYDGIQGFPDKTTDAGHVYPFFTYNSKYPMGATTGRIFLVDNDGDKAMRQFVDSSKYGGAYILWTIPGNNIEMWTSANIKLMSGTNFNRGGKIGVGLRAWGWTPREFVVPSDGFNNTSKFNLDSTISIINYSEGLSHYMTYPNMPSTGIPQYGKAFTYSDTLQADGTRLLKYWKIPNNGDWFNITTRTVMNDPPSSTNGFIEVWINGTFSHHWGGLQLRTTSNTYIDIGRLSFFFGGDTPTQGAPKDSWVEYDDVYFYNYNETSDMPRGVSQPANTTQHRTIKVPGWPKN